MRKKTLFSLIALLSFASLLAEYSRLKPEEIIINNPGELVKPEFIDNQGTHLWKTLAYESESFSGVMIAEGGSNDIPPVRIPLDIQGKY